MRSVFVFAGLSAALVLSDPLLAQQTNGRGGRGGGRGTPIQPGESARPARRRSGREAAWRPSSRRRASSTIGRSRRSSTPAHMVKTAKYPAIDYHGHPQGLLSSADGLDEPRRARSTA